MPGDTVRCTMASTRVSVILHLLVPGRFPPIAALPSADKNHPFSPEPLRHVFLATPHASPLVPCGEVVRDAPVPSPRSAGPVVHRGRLLPHSDLSSALSLVTSRAGSWSSRPLGIFTMVESWSVGPGLKVLPFAAAFA